MEFTVYLLCSSLSLLARSDMWTICNYYQDTRHFEFSKIPSPLSNNYLVTKPYFRMLNNIYFRSIVSTPLILKWLTIFFLLLGFLFCFVCSLFEKIFYIAQASLKHIAVLLPQPPRILQAWVSRLNICLMFPAVIKNENIRQNLTCSSLKSFS